ncbi:hypothetical protein [Parafrankia sp. FMc2]|uniref:hypothetical protein n=1 Tax=Parafrankia sp. FMc2 TaxID=3233196 RepID=UPI0034D69A45
MLPFDSNDYRRRVLAALHARGGAEQSDPFEIYDIPVVEAPRLGDAEVRARLDEVWAFWQRSRDHPRYRGVIIALLGLHDELSSALATAASRADLAERVTAARAARDSERFAELDAAVRRLVSRFGGLPEDKVAALRALAAAQGVDEAAFAQRIRRYRLLPAGAPERATSGQARRAVPAEVIRQIRADLDELGRIAGTTPPRSLFDLLGVSPGSTREEIRAVRDAAAARNRERRPDRRRALLDDLLTAVRSLLVEGDPEAYLDALVEPVRAALRSRVATAVLIEDRLLASAAAEFVAHAEAEGLDPARARTVVADLARENGVEAPDVAYTPRRSGGAGGGAGAGAAEGGGVVPPGRDVPAPAPGRTRDWQALLSRARAALRAGRPIEASDEISRAREAAGETLPPIRALGDEVERVIRAAGESWRVIVAEAGADRHRAVARLTEDLARVAADVPGPGGRVLDEVRATARARCAQADELVRRAREAPGPERIQLAREALAAVADHEEAHGLLADSPDADAALRPARPARPARQRPAAAPGDGSNEGPGEGSGEGSGGRPEPERGQARVPEQERVSADDRPAPAAVSSAVVPSAAEAQVVEAPSGVSARWDGASVVVSWRPTITPGDVRYRIRRITADGNARAVGVTAATSIEDGGVYRGSSIPEYEVIAGVGGVWSAPARWPEPVRGEDPARDQERVPEPERAASGATGEGGGTQVPGRLPPVPAPAEAPATAAGAVPVAEAVPAAEAVPVPDAVPGPTDVRVPPPGPRTAADELDPASDLRLVAGRLCWTWPSGCTEMMVTARADLPPAGAQELGSITRKITNTRYDIDGGFALPEARPLHVALFACVRAHGELVVAGAAAGRCLVDAAGVLVVIAATPGVAAPATGASGGARTA